MEEKQAKPRLFGEYMEELGICTADQVSTALEYCTACSKRNTYLSIGQALVELGYTTQDSIEAVLQIQAKDRAAAGGDVVETAEPTEASEPVGVAEQAETQAELEEQAAAAEQVEEWDILTPEQAEQSGIFTAEQVRDAMQHCTACSKIRRYLSLGEALVELGYATRDEIDQIMTAPVEAQGPPERQDTSAMAEALMDDEQWTAAGEAAQALGLCTSEQLENALGYCSDCAKRHRQLSLAQALIELGYTTQDGIEEVLNPSPQVEETQPHSEQPNQTHSDHPGILRDRFRRPQRRP
jgi:Holliday junction resolvasome RuvABC DNA-binding subunit